MAVLELTQTNPEYNQPALYTKQAGIHGGAASIRIDDPNPDIEFVETGLPKPVCRVLIPTLGSSRLPFRPTNSRSMAAKPMLAPTKALKPLSYLRGRQRAAISVSDSRKPIMKSLEEKRVSL
jgi:hypothetical protein